MFAKLNVFQIAMAAARHSGARQALVSQNIANADTPGYAARDLMPFKDIIGNEMTRLSVSKALRASRPGHLHGARENGFIEATVAETVSENPNGNAVSVEEQMLRAVELRRQHDRSLAIYKSNLTILRTSLGRR
ncbi:MAG: FlgB family protein [Rhodobacteraceae bacterium]|nr:FlgB family protein [Paracoccaceae bacterium]